MSTVLLALDTSEQACSVALSVSGDCLYRQCIRPREHTKMIWPMIHALLAEAELKLSMLDAVVCGQGPGSFTGLRVACSVAQGIAVGLDCPIVPLNTLECLAYGGWRRSKHVRIWPMMDARMGGVYTAVYAFDSNQIKCLSPMQVLPYDALDQVSQTLSDSEGFYAVGSAWPLETVRAWREQAQQVLDTGPIFPEDLMHLGAARYAQHEHVNAVDFKPIYLRRSVQ